jgi:predicted RNA binding protein with dsRBD fold (UPF0201 family)
MNAEDKEKVKKAIARLTTEIEVLVEKRMEEIINEEEEEDVTEFGAGVKEDEDEEDD